MGSELTKMLIKAALIERFWEILGLALLFVGLHFIAAAAPPRLPAPTPCTTSGSGSSGKNTSQLIYDGYIQ